jgi:hypothetical protein
MIEWVFHQCQACGHIYAIAGDWYLGRDLTCTRGAAPLLCRGPVQQLHGVHHEVVATAMAFGGHGALMGWQVLR